MTRLATLDIGTNTCLLLIADVAHDGNIRVLEECAHITRLGQGVAISGELQPEAVTRTLTTITDYAERCRAHHVERIAAVGTEALRRATNANDFVQRVKHNTGITVEIISAPREAALTFAAAARDFGNDITVIDIGGGSTEIISLTDPADFTSGLSFVSLKIGSVVLTERHLPSDPVTAKEFTALLDGVEHILAQELSDRKSMGKKLIATAGTATTLAAMHAQLTTYDQARVHGSTLTHTQIAKLIGQMKPLSVSERKKIPGLHPDRADVILAGAVLLGLIMDHLGFTEVTVSDRGVRWGLLYECAAISKHR